VAAALALYLTLPHRLTMVPSWVLPSLEGSFFCSRSR
jgi:hypothetical protein